MLTDIQGEDSACAKALRWELPEEQREGAGRGRGGGQRILGCGGRPEGALSGIIDFCVYSERQWGPVRGTEEQSHTGAVLRIGSRSGGGGREASEVLPLG